MKFFVLIALFHIAVIDCARQQILPTNDCSAVACPQIACLSIDDISSAESRIVECCPRCPELPTGPIKPIISIYKYYYYYYYYY